MKKKLRLVIGLLCVLSMISGAIGALAAVYPTENMYLRYDFNGGDGTPVDISGNNRNGTVNGTPAVETALNGNGLKFTGSNQNILVPGSADMSGDLTIDVIFRPDAETTASQDLAVVGKHKQNTYREWVLSLNDNKVRLAYRNGSSWGFLYSTFSYECGEYYQATFTVSGNTITLYVNGVFQESQTWAGRASTDALVSIGGSEDFQWFNGLVDDVAIYKKALTESEVQAMVSDGVDTNVSEGEKGPGTDDPGDSEPAEKYELWDSSDSFPLVKDMEQVHGITYASIKPSFYQEKNGLYEWQHGPSVIAYKDKMYSTFGVNSERENTAGERAKIYVSEDKGETWEFHSEIKPEQGYGVSHGLFMEYEGKLLALLPVFGGSDPGTRFPNLKTYAFELNNETGEWENKGVVINDFWPLRQPEKLENGNWFMSGCDRYWRGAVAISNGDNVMNLWTDKKIQMDQGITYTESAAIVDGPNITLIMRNESPIVPEENCAAVSVSTDYGETFSKAVESNMPLTTSKPYAGTLSDGRSYLVGNSAGYPSKTSRARFTIALTEPGGSKFTTVYLLRRGIVVPDNLEELYDGVPVHDNMSYPHCFEYDGKLYISHSTMVAGGNRNHMELAIIPIESLQDLSLSFEKNIEQSDINSENTANAPTFNDKTCTMRFDSTDQFVSYTRNSALDGITISISGITYQVDSSNAHSILAFTLSPNEGDFNGKGTESGLYFRLVVGSDGYTRLDVVKASGRVTRQADVFIRSMMVKSLHNGLGKSMKITFRSNGTGYSVLINDYEIKLPESANEYIAQQFPDGDTKVMLGGAGNITYTLSGIETEDPTGTDPTGTDPTGTDPTGTNPTGTNPTSTNPTGTTNQSGTPVTGVSLPLQMLCVVLTAGAVAALCVILKKRVKLRVR